MASLLSNLHISNKNVMKHVKDAKLVQIVLKLFSGDWRSLLTLIYAIGNINMIER